MLPDSLRDEVDLKTGEHVADYAKTRNFVMRFAEAKRKHRDDAMDTSPVNLEEHQGQEQWDPSWGGGWDEWGPADSGPEVDAMGYGKGPVKGFGKNAYNKGGKSYNNFGSFGGKSS